MQVSADMSVPNGNDPPTLIADYALETAFNLCVAGQDYTLWWELGRAALERMKADSQDDGEDTTAFAVSTTAPSVRAWTRTRARHTSAPPILVPPLVYGRGADSRAHPTYRIAELL